MSSVPAIPKDLNAWDVGLLDNLLNIPSVESETFDFKEARIGDLAVHICAMANTASGILVLGVEEDRSPSNQLLGFKKNGYLPQDEEKIRQRIRDFAYQVEPLPKVEMKVLADSGMIYFVVRVEGEDIKRPYTIKGKGQCYIRVLDSSTPATGSIIVNLISEQRQRIKNVNMLRVAALLLKEAVMETSQRIQSAGESNNFSVAPVDLTLIRSAVAMAEDFLVENNLMGGHTDTGSQYIGLHYYLYLIGLLNVMIDKYNYERDPARRGELARAMDNWSPNRSESAQVIRFLDGLIEHCNKFIRSKSQ